MEAISLRHRGDELHSDVLYSLFVVYGLHMACPKKIAVSSKKQNMFIFLVVVTILSGD